MRCTATAKGTGERCRKYVTPGTTVCPMHGQTGATLRRAEERVTLAQLLEGDRRHPWEVVLDATHTMDAIVRDFRSEVVAGESITVDQLDRLIAVNQIRHHLASTAISTRAHEQVSLAFTRHLEVEGQLVGTALGAAIDGLDLTEPWRRYALELAHWTLLGEGDTSRGDQPQPPSEPIVREYDVGPRSNAPAIEAIPSTPVPCDVAALDDNELRDLGSSVLDELERRGVDG
jgi:hypothetical protein